MSLPDVAPSFSTRWTSLPDELKLEVLKHAFPNHLRHCAIDHTKFRRDMQSDGHLFALFAVPALSELAKEAYYKSHTFSLSRRDGNPIRFPLYACHWIRRLRISVYPRDSDWLMMSRVLGKFSQLVRLTVVVKYHSREYDSREDPISDRLEHAEKIVVGGSVKELTVRYDGDGIDLDQEISPAVQGFMISNRVFGKIGLECEELDLVKETRTPVYGGYIIRQLR